jgi:Flp pilus assembly protein protease CpaA
LSLAIAPLLGFRTEMENLAVLVIPLALVFAIIHDRWRRIGNWLTFLLMLIVFGVPWTINYFFLEHLGSMAQNITFLFLPLFTVVGLYWIRWWAIRPPRILSDLANLP